MTLQDKKNAEIRKIFDKMEKLEQFMIDEGNEGRGYGPKAKAALRRYQQLEKQISYIQFHKYRHLEPEGSRYAAKGYHGVVRKPTLFHVGENYEAERVNITPIHKKQNHIHHGFKLDLGEPKGFYYGTKEKKRTGFGEIDFDFGLKL